MLSRLDFDSHDIGVGIIEKLRNSQYPSDADDWIWCDKNIDKISAKAKTEAAKMCETNSSKLSSKFENAATNDSEQLNRLQHPYIVEDKRLSELYDIYKLNITSGFAWIKRRFTHNVIKLVASDEEKGYVEILVSIFCERLERIITSVIPQKPELRIIPVTEQVFVSSKKVCGCGLLEVKTSFITLLLAFVRHFLSKTVVLVHSDATIGSKWQVHTTTTNHHVSTTDGETDDRFAEEKVNSYIEIKNKDV